MNPLLVGVLVTAVLAAIGPTLVGVAALLQLRSVKTNVDGNMKDLKAELKVTTAALLALTEKAGIAQGTAQQKERAEAATSDGQET
jgi:hypothetical protein